MHDGIHIRENDITTEGTEIYRISCLSRRERIHMRQAKNSIWGSVEFFPPQLSLSHLLN